MSENLTAEERENQGLAEAVGEAASRGGQPVLPGLPDMEQPALATVVGTDGRIMRIVVESDRGISIHIGGRGNPLRLDRFQTVALALAFEHQLEAVGP